jgi:hypothetical protein
MKSLAEKYFQSILDKKQHIEDMLDYRKELQERAASIGSVDTSKERVQTSHTTDRVSTMAVELTELDQKIEKEKIELWTVTEDCIEKIRKLRDLNYIRVLHKLYIQFKTHKQVAAETNHHIGWVFKKQEEAIQLFNQVHYDFLCEWVEKGSDCTEQK